MVIGQTRVHHRLDDDRIVGKAQCGFRLPSVGQTVVDLVRYQANPEPPANIANLAELLCVDHRPGRICRAGDQHTVQGLICMGVGNLIRAQYPAGLWSDLNIDRFKTE